VVFDRRVRARFHILRLGARIWDLRHDGYEIEERRVEGTNWSEYRPPPCVLLILLLISTDLRVLYPHWNLGVGEK
jgi:hypothetical protein